jgi:hypothetical protein
MGASFSKSAVVKFGTESDWDRATIQYHSLAEVIAQASPDHDAKVVSE